MTAGSGGTGRAREPWVEASRERLRVDAAWWNAGRYTPYGDHLQPRVLPVLGCLLGNVWEFMEQRGNSLLRVLRATLQVKKKYIYNTDVNIRKESHNTGELSNSI